MRDQPQADGSDTDSVSDWIKQLRAGDRSAAQKLWERYFRRLTSLAQCKLPRRPGVIDDEEDVALSVFDSFCRGAERGRYPLLDDRENLWRLLFVITVHKVRHALRDATRQKRGGQHSTLAEIDAELSSADVTAVYPVVAELHAEEEFPVNVLCQVLPVSRAAWYAWQQGEPSPRQREDNRLGPLIRGLFRKHKRRYGARRIAQDLAELGESCGVTRVGRLMAEMGLEALQPRGFRPKTTDSRHGLGYSPNRLLDAAPPDGINQLWVADITFIPLLPGGFLYLAGVMDRYSRRVVGWALAEHMEEALVLAATRMAIAARQPPPGLVHHSDRGGQYAGHAYRGLLQRARMLQSMSRAGNCYDNAFMESCFGTIKTELEMEPYENAAVARKEVAEYIRYYNSRRRHSALAYQSPAAFEATLTRSPRTSRE